MKSYMEIAVEFSSLEFEEKNDYLLNVLSLEELKLFGEGWTSGWSKHIDYVYKKRVSENRDNKLNELGI